MDLLLVSGMHSCFFMATMFPTKIFYLIKYKPSCEHSTQEITSCSMAFIKQLNGGKNYTSTKFKSLPKLSFLKYNAMTAMLIQIRAVIHPLIT